MAPLAKVATTITEQQTSAKKREGLQDKLQKRFADALHRPHCFEALQPLSQQGFFRLNMKLNHQFRGEQAVR